MYTFKNNNELFLCIQFPLVNIYIKCISEYIEEKNLIILHEIHNNWYILGTVSFENTLQADIKKLSHQEAFNLFWSNEINDLLGETIKYFLVQDPNQNFPIINEWLAELKNISKYNASDLV